MVNKLFYIPSLAFPLCLNWKLAILQERGFPRHSFELRGVYPTKPHTPQGQEVSLVFSQFHDTIAGHYTEN